MKLNFLFLTKFLVACFLAFCAFGFVACSDDDDGPSVDSVVVGTWVNERGDQELTFNSDGTWIMSKDNGGQVENGPFSTSGGKLTITYPGKGYETYSYRVSDNKLTLMETDEDGTTWVMVFTKK